MRNIPAESVWDVADGLNTITKSVLFDHLLNVDTPVTITACVVGLRRTRRRRRRNKPILK